MILATKGSTAHPDLIEQMFRLRAQVFAKRLGWDVRVINDKEIDRFDALKPLYLLSVDATRTRLCGAVRLLPTTGPNMLRDVFSALVPDGPVESPVIWESSRFAVDMTHRPERPERTLVGGPTIELLCGLVEVSQLIGVEQIVSVFDSRMARIFRAADCPFELIGTPQSIGGTMTYAGLFTISAELRHRLAVAGHVKGPVLATSPKAVLTLLKRS
jgi:acyl homoserine lactone synthase